MNHTTKKLCSFLLTLAIALPSLPIPGARASAVVPAEEKAQEALPDYYDLREEGLVTEVKDQGRNETCWAFALASVMESNALVRGYGTNDVSEYQIAYALSHQLDLDDDLASGEGPWCTDDWLEGIFAESLSSELMRGFAIQSEEDFPYTDIREPLPEKGFSQDGLLYVDSCYTVPMTETDTIKRMVMQNGALYMNICAASWWELPSIYDWEVNAAYLPEYGERKNDHFVAIVGWDDHYSKDHFLTTPPGDGAWIMKNSWGPAYGFEGFFYLSYYDASVNPDNCATSITVKNKRTYDRIYQYDGGVGLEALGQVTDVAMNLTAAEDEAVTAIRIKPTGDLDCTHYATRDWTFSPTAATVRIYEGSFDAAQAETADPVFVQTYDVLFPDYQTIELRGRVPLRKGEDYWVKVSFDKPVYYAIDGENKKLDHFYESVAGGKPGETFLRTRGQPGRGVWKDTVDVLGNGKTCSACVKVLTQRASARLLESLRLTNQVHRFLQKTVGAFLRAIA